MSNAKKAKRAVLVSISQEGADLRLRLDDVAHDGGDPDRWRQVDHFTSKVLSMKNFDDLEFDEKELADFGHHILARLHAFKTVGEA